MFRGSDMGESRSEYTTAIGRSARSEFSYGNHESPRFPLQVNLRHRLCRAHRFQSTHVAGQERGYQAARYYYAQRVTQREELRGETDGGRPDDEPDITDACDGCNARARINGFHAATGTKDEGNDYGEACAC